MARSIDPPDRSWPFVGREETVRRIVGGIANSPARAFLLHGASGIGKSRTSVEAASRLEASGWAVLRIQGTAGLAHSPLAALSPLFSAGEPLPLGEDPVALLGAAAARIEELAAGRRTVLLVDDVSLVDPLSLALVIQLLQTRAIKLLLTARAGDALPDALVALWTSDGVTRIDLPALVFDEVNLLLREFLGAQVAMHALSTLTDSSRGNPLYLRELVLGALADGRLVQRDGSWQLVGELSGTSALRELIEARMRGLDAAARDVAERLALCGALPVDELEVPDVRSTLTSLEAMGVVEVTESPQGLTVALSHPQYVSVLRASIPRLRAADLLFEQASIVVHRGGDAPSGRDAMRVAMWSLDAGRPTNPVLLLRGARLARLGNDHPVALRLAEAAIAAGADDAAAHLLLGEVLRTVGRTDQALRELAEAERIAIATGDDAARIEAVGFHALGLADTEAGSAAGLRQLEELIAAIPSAADATRAVRAVLLMNEDRAAEAVALIDAPDIPTIETDIVGCVPLAAVGRASDALAASERIVAHIDASPAHQAQLSRRMAMFLRATVLLMTGRPREATVSAMDALQDAIASADELATRRAEFTLGHAFIELGAMRTAGRWFRDVASGSLAHGPISYRGSALGALAQVQLWQGRLDEARVTLADVPDDAADDASTIGARAWLAALDGDAATGQEVLIERAGRYGDGGHTFLESWMLLNAARIGGAERVAPRLRELADAGDSPLADARARHAEALVDGSAAALESAAERWRELDYALLAAELFAAASRAASAGGDARTAARMAAAAAELTEASQGADIPGLRTSAGADILTPREREIAALAAGGASSQAIADQLFLSIRTVDNHLQSVYRKLGISGRTELEGAF